MSKPTAEYIRVRFYARYAKMSAAQRQGVREALDAMDVIAREDASPQPQQLPLPEPVEAEEGEAD